MQLKYKNNKTKLPCNLPFKGIKYTQKYKYVNMQYFINILHINN